MNNNNNSNKGAVGGVSFTGLLTIAFIVLKLCGVINWSWWWVISPIWISIGLVVLIIIVVVAVTGVQTLAERRKRKKWY